MNKKKKKNLIIIIIFSIIIILLSYIFFYKSIYNMNYDKYQNQNNNLNNNNNDNIKNKKINDLYLIFEELKNEYQITKDLYVKINSLDDTINELESNFKNKDINSIKNNLNKFSKIKDSIYIKSEENELFYDKGILILNKDHSAPSYFSPGFRKITENAFNKMKIDAEKENITLINFSGFRSYQLQENLYNKYVQKDGKEKADTYSAKPGFSEHQTGYALDIGGENESLWAEEEFENTKEAKWINDNCYKYGFILRYPKDKTQITGYIYEPWHCRYVGKISEKIKNTNLTLEEYLKTLD